MVLLKGKALHLSGPPKKKSWEGINSLEPFKDSLYFKRGDHSQMPPIKGPRQDPAKMRVIFSELLLHRVFFWGGGVEEESCFQPDQAKSTYLPQIGG